VVKEPRDDDILEPRGHRSSETSEHGGY
jgi:hypothetical protein